MDLETFFYLLKGLGLTIVMAFFAGVGAILFGAILATMRNYGGTLVRGIASAYIEIFRNTPLLLWMYATCFVLPMIFNIPANYAVLGTLGLFLYTSSVMAEIIRGGLNSISQGQFEAGYSQGFKLPFILWYIVFPQAFRRVTPTILSQCVTTIKDTSFLAALNVAELTNVSKDILSKATTFMDITIIFAVVAFLYFAVCFTLSIAIRTYSHKTRINR